MHAIKITMLVISMLMTSNSKKNLHDNSKMKFKNLEKTHKLFEKEVLLK